MLKNRCNIFPYLFCSASLFFRRIRTCEQALFVFSFHCSLALFNACQEHFFSVKIQLSAGTACICYKSLYRDCLHACFVSYTASTSQILLEYVFLLFFEHVDHFPMLLHVSTRSKFAGPPSVFRSLFLSSFPLLRSTLLLYHFPLYLYDLTSYYDARARLVLGGPLPKNQPARLDPRALIRLKIAPWTIFSDF